MCVGDDDGDGGGGGVGSGTTLRVHTINSSVTLILSNLVFWEFVYEL